MHKVTIENIKKYIGQTVAIRVDQAIGSTYSGHGEKITYPINYGFVPNTISGDGAELDAYILGVEDPLIEFEGECIAIIHRENDDNDDKLVIVQKGNSFSDEEIIKLTHFQEKFFEIKIWR